MIPHVITEEQKAIAEWYWQQSWTSLTAEQVQEALDAWNKRSAQLWYQDAKP